MISFPPAAILIFGAILLPFLPRKIRSTAFLVFPAFAFCWLLNLNPGSSLIINLLGHNLVITQVDRLSLCFGYVFCAVAFFGGIYGFHIKNTAEQVSALLYSGSSLGVIFAGDLFTLFVFWEMMALSSVYLIWARGTPLARGAGLRYLMVHLFGGSVLLAGILIQVTQTGSTVFTLFNGGLASYLILFGFCLNAAVPPLHAWLSDAYPEGTVTGSVFLSAFTTKTAVYALARGFAGWEILIWAGAAMAIFGVIYAVLENDARRLLAYHIISQVGYMVCAVGLGTEAAINGATVHAFAHILYKALLFMGAGAVLYATGRSKLSELGGLAKLMPITLCLYMIGAFSISGFPLFSGFVSKSMVVYAAGQSHFELVVLLLNVASVGTFLHTGLKLPYFTWFGKGASDLKPSRIPVGMYVGMGLTALACFIIGIYPDLIYNLLPYKVNYHPYTAAHVIETVQLLVFTGLGFWLLIRWLGGKALITLDFDWFYRRPAGLAYKVLVAGVSRLFGMVENGATRLVQITGECCTNPLAYLGKLVKPASSVSIQSSDYDPDRYRVSVALMTSIIIIIFVFLLAWGLFISI